MPERIQLRRSKGWRLPEGAVIVDRRTKWGNPYTPKNFFIVDPVEWQSRPATIAECVDAYRRDLTCVDANCPPDEHAWSIGLDLAELRGKNLACYCPLPEPGQSDICHAAVLLELANNIPEEAKTDA